MIQNILKKSCFFFACLGCLMAYACNKDDNQASELAYKVQLNLGKYYNSLGTSTLTLWNADTKAALLLVGEGTSTVSYANPILAGTSEGSFVFNVIASENQSSTVISYYPTDWAITCVNGKLKTTLPVQQKGEIVPAMIGKTQTPVNANEGCSIDLNQLYCTMYIHVRQGNYAITKAQVVANGGEGIAGNISIDTQSWKITATKSSVMVGLDQPLDCKEASQMIPVMLTPGTLSKGYTITLTDTNNKQITIEEMSPVILGAGGKVLTEEAVGSDRTELVFCGSDKVYMIDPSLADQTGYSNAIIWNWDATSAASLLGLATSRCNHLDDCKPVNNNKQLLITSSYSWCVLLDIATKKILFHTTQCPNAHSAELLPNNRIAVACSDGTDANSNKIQIYDIAQPNKVLFQTNLTSAHGVVWNNLTQSLYAIGGQSLQIYHLKDWNSKTPSIELVKTVQTPQSGLHDMSYMNANMLCIGGRRAYLYNIGADKFTELTFFAASTAVKSINYNDKTGELWYTDSTIPEGTQTWSTQTIGYLTNGNASAPTKTIKVPDLDMYKVRVKNW